MTIRESKRADSLSHCGLTDAVTARSLPVTAAYINYCFITGHILRAFISSINHKSFFLINILVHLCDISNLNYQQVKPRNFQSGMLMNGKLSRPETRIFIAV